jgi:uncharacterized protein DUF1353
MMIKYRAGYKYQLLDDYSHDVGILDTMHYGALLELQPSGILLIRTGYAWDGPSGPTIDTPDFMRASLVHDALYQLMRERVLDWRRHRVAADLLLRDICLADGMRPARATWVYCAVRACGEQCAMPPEDRPEAPIWPEGST